MFKPLFCLLFLMFLVCSAGFAQTSEMLVPKGASTVFSINNINLLKKISIDELVRYDFMEEIHHELFDGSTSGKTLKDAGIDFDQRLNIFYGKDEQVEVSGFSFGIKDKISLFQVFDDFEFVDMISEGIERYGSFFNTLVLNNESALLVKVEPRDAFVTQMTDSIWYARGNENPYGLLEYEMIDLIDDGKLSEEDLELDVLEEDYENNYWEIRDSVEVKLQLYYMSQLLENLFNKGESLYASDSRFAKQLERSSEAVFYLDNSRNITNEQGLWYFQTMYPIMNDDLKELYQDNIMLGDLTIDSGEINFDVQANYGEELGEIYTEMNNNKPNKEFLKFISQDSPAYMIYNIDIKKAYEKAYDIVLPILKKQKNMDMLMNVLAIQLLDQLVDKKSFFSAYKGGMFASFDGVEKVNTTKIEYQWDEENFDYSEIEVQSDEEIPVFTIGFASERPDLTEMILEDLARLTSRIQKKEDYWVMEDAILDATPIYIVSTKKVLLITNNHKLVEENLKGYGGNAITRKDIKKIKGSGVVYAQVDLDESLQKFPIEFLDERQKLVLEQMKGSSGSIELTSGSSGLQSTKYNIQYCYEGDSDSGKQFLDMINSIYIFSK